MGERWEKGASGSRNSTFKGPVAQHIPEPERESVCLDERLNGRLGSDGAWGVEGRVLDHTRF